MNIIVGMNDPRVEIKPSTQGKGSIHNDLPSLPMRCLIVAPSGAGKSTLLAKLFTMKGGYQNYFRKCDIIIFNTTYGLDPTFMKIPHSPDNVFREFREDIMLDVFQQLEALKLNMPDRVPNTLFIFEDCGASNIFKNNKMFNFLAFQSRHLSCSFIILSQKYTSVSTSLRRNCDCLMLLQPYNYAELQAIVDENSDKENKKKFRNMLVNIFEEKDFNSVTITYKRGYPRYKKNLNEVIRLEDY